MRLLVVVGVCALLVASPATATTTAAPTGEPPLAEAGLDQTVQRGAGVILDAGGSRDPDGEITGYDWQIKAPNGTTVTPECSDCEQTRFTADTVGEYNVTVEVTDDDGNTANDTLYVTVESPPDGPTVSLSGDTAPSVDAPARYDATATAGDAELKTVEWTVDGQNATEQDVGEESATESLIRAFDDASPRTVRVTVTDEAGRTASDALRIDPRAERNDRGAPEGPPESTPTLEEMDTPYEPCAENQEPDVSADARVSVDMRASGEVAYISSEQSDPDGSIIDVRYKPGSTVPVPEAGKTKTATVTVEDNCGATASDVVLIGQETDEKTIQKTKTQEVENENVIEVRIDGWAVVGSKIRSGKSSDLPDTVSGQVDRAPEMRAVIGSTEWTVIKNHVGHRENTSKDGTRLSGEDATQTEIQYVNETETVKITETELKTDVTPYEKSGKTVTNDLNNDGKIDIVDWRQKYPSHNTVEETNNDHDDDGHNSVKSLEEKDENNDGTAEVCSRGYCMDLDTDLNNNGGANNDNDGGANNNGGTNNNNNGGTEDDELSEQATNSQMSDETKDAFVKYAREN
ncbi:hypothetical protein BRD04_04980 [Halobacteriales archaeon QS_9_67_17]|nr:MAG: hypothetical protein BRD04_04980 [Halobacteriales archaeon QS_9_67_17]